jgi:hypothetical protein
VSICNTSAALNYFYFSELPLTILHTASVGLIGAFAVYFFRNKKIMGRQADSGLASIRRTVLINVMYSAGSANIDNMAHLLGFLGLSFIRSEIHSIAQYYSSLILLSIYTIGGALVSYGIGPNFSIIDSGYGGRRVVDRPVIPYKKLFSNMSAMFGSTKRLPSFD